MKRKGERTRSFPRNGRPISKTKHQQRPRFPQPCPPPPRQINESTGHSYSQKEMQLNRKTTSHLAPPSLFPITPSCRFLMIQSWSVLVHTCLLAVSWKHRKKSDVRLMPLYTRPKLKLKLDVSWKPKQLWGFLYTNAQNQTWNDLASAIYVYIEKTTSSGTH